MTSIPAALWEANYRFLSRVAFHFEKHRSPAFCCPICEYNGPFASRYAETGKRSFAACPGCGALERHRLQWLVLCELQKEIPLSRLRVLHIAPEPFFESRLRKRCASYVTADINAAGVDRREDLTRLSFADHSFDLVYASHVLEHIADDTSAIHEIHRVLVPNGLAILPVPIVAHATAEYGAANPHEAGHVRAPGVDYFDRYQRVFQRVRVFESASFAPLHQVWIYEDRSGWPTSKMPNRRPMAGVKHSDYVPVCYA